MADTKEVGSSPPADIHNVPVPDLDASDPSKTHHNVIENARAAAAKEQQMTLLQGIKLYPKAIAWSVLISTCIVMEGYQISLVNNFYAFPQFNEKYGHQLADGSYEVSAPWQAGLSNVRVPIRFLFQTSMLMSKRAPKSERSLVSSSTASSRSASATATPS